MSCKYNNCKHCGYKSECEIFKENTELKYRLEHRNCVICSNHGSNIKLIKAKEIIKDLLNLPFASNEEVFADVGSHLQKAEQFLKEVEK